jgi:hypothetical protein
MGGGTINFDVTTRGSASVFLAQDGVATVGLEGASVQVLG